MVTSSVEVSDILLFVAPDVERGVAWLPVAIPVLDIVIALERTYRCGEQLAAELFGNVQAIAVRFDLDGVV